MSKKYLITSALPYVNGELHIGHLVGCLLPSDVYARFCRAMGRDVLFICGSDEHGTPSVIGAKKEGIPVLEYNNRYYEKHLRAVSDFRLSFDTYGRTHTETQVKLVQSLFTRWDELGLIEERVMKQPFSVDDNMFLADRQIAGTCPKCGATDAHGDECEACGAVLEPSDLINPYSTISNGKNIEFRDTKHLYFLYSKLEPKLRAWIDSRVGWPKTATAIANKWLKEGLQDTPITRDLPWGIPVNKPGFEDKVFYVWFDAPWGYVSISQIANENWADWWKNDDCHYTQFMGKDNVSFHAVFFPAQELALNDGWKTVDVLKAVNFLNFEGAKISKSKKNGVFLDTAIDDAPSDMWRYALMASAPETDDSDFTIQRFADIVNKDLNGMLGNFVSRVTKLTEKNFGNHVPKTENRKPKTETNDLEQKINSGLVELTAALDACEFRRAIAAIRSLWSAGNEFLTATAPWSLVKESEKRKAESENEKADELMGQAGGILNECFQLIDLYARVSAPFIPDAAMKMQGIFTRTENRKPKTDLWPKSFERRVADGAEFVVPENLFERIDDDKIKAMIEKYAKK